MFEYTYENDPFTVKPVKPFNLNAEAYCDECGELMEDGEEAIEVFHGKIGKGKKSGQPMVVDMSEQGNSSILAKLHIWCAISFIEKHVYDVRDDPTAPSFCEACGDKIDGKSDD